MPRWVPAAVAAAVIAAGVAGIALIAGGGDDDDGDTANLDSGAPAGAAAPPVTSATATTPAPTATATPTAPPATTSATTVQPTTTEQTTTTTTLPPTTTTTISPRLDPERITGYEITRTMTRAYDADGPTPNLLQPEPGRLSTFCEKGRCVYPWIEEIPFDAGQKRIDGLQQYEFGCGIIRAESVNLRRTITGAYRGFERSTTEPMRTGGCDTIAYEWRITMKPITR